MMTNLNPTANRLETAIEKKLQYAWEEQFDRIKDGLSTEHADGKIIAYQAALKLIREGIPERALEYTESEKETIADNPKFHRL